jgi:hypothetical protein
MVPNKTWISNTTTFSSAKAFLGSDPPKTLDHAYATMGFWLVADPCAPVGIPVSAVPDEVDFLVRILFSPALNWQSSRSILLASYAELLTNRIIDGSL